MDHRAQSVLPAAVLGAALAMGCALVATHPSRDWGSVETSGGLPRVEVVIAGRTFELEVAATEAAIERGLGGRSGLASGTGMLFVFEKPGPQGFVMRDCPFPLGLLFLDKDGLVISTARMQPERPRGVGEPHEEYESRLQIYFCERDCFFAIEISEGDVNGRNIQPGDKIKLPDGVIRRPNAVSP